MSSNQDDDDFSSKITVLMIGVGSAALVVILYHCITMGWCSRHRPARTARPQRFAPEITGAHSSIENSAAQLIPAYMYQRGVTLVGDEGGTCAICLGEFEEGEELRTLPECMHTFHVPCIDMWLNSHSNCPMCRTDAISSPQVVLRSMDFDPEEGSDTFTTNVGTLQNVTVISPNNMM